MNPNLLSDNKNEFNLILFTKYLNIYVKVHFQNSFKYKYSNMDDSQRVSILSAFHTQRFSGRKIVIKYGGSVMEKDNLKNAFFRDVALLSSVGVCSVVIHGGGPEINSWLNKLEISPKFEKGLRVTDPKTMKIVEMVLMGRVNKQIVRGINNSKIAVGISGLDGNLIQSRELDGSHGLVEK